MSRDSADGTRSVHATVASSSVALALQSAHCLVIMPAPDETTPEILVNTPNHVVFTLYKHARVLSITTIISRDELNSPTPHDTMQSKARNTVTHALRCRKQCGPRNANLGRRVVSIPGITQGRQARSDSRWGLDDDSRNDSRIPRGW